MSDEERDDTRSRDSDFAAMWSSDGVTRSMSPTGSGLPADLPFLFSGGQRFGGYAIIRPLGKGGMGQVYEAEETDSGRRVALKLLSRGLGDDEERERFLREGQLAASLSHPNCVYVFGTSEIQGFPVIAMELVPEGTLKDLVVPGKPMAAAAAVDAIVQVIDGLEAAASIGILHRDVKPSNCFVHRDGRVLVGDFGLSVAATHRDAQGSGQGTILGTPGFASPEQLRGDSLDVRSDIYAVGATIFYLLAGRAPFDDRDTTSLLKRVATEPPPLLTSLRPDLPRGLAAVVAKCLSKTAAERFGDYAALRAALEPLGSARYAPAPLVRRTVAGILDSWLTGLTLAPVNMVLQVWPMAQHRADGVILAAVAVIVAVLYYGLLEGLWGAAVGKALMGVRVVDIDQVTPGVGRAAARALAFELPSQVVKQLAVVLLLRAMPELSAGFITATAGVVWFAVLFSTARRKNGYTALHDRFTDTRVVRRRLKAETRDRVARARADAVVPFEDAERLGPFLVPSSTRLDGSARIRITGFDDRLNRRVWIELLPAGAPALPAWRRDLSRPARLRWLAGRRAEGECWDAYEAIDGAPFASLAGTPQPWSRVRHWMADLAREAVAALDDGSAPAFRPSRVWIGADGHARILEWPAPGQIGAGEDDDTSGDLATAQRFLYGLATAALVGVTFDKALTIAPEVPLPLRARTFLLALRDASFTSGVAVLDSLAETAVGPAAVSKARRFTQIAASAAVPVTMTIFSSGALLLIGNSKSADRTLFSLEALLNDLEKTERSLAKAPDPAVQQKHDDIEIYLAEHMREVIERPSTWTSSAPKIGARGGRERARRALQRHPVRTPEEVRHADAAVGPIVARQANGLDQLGSTRMVGRIIVGIFGGMFVAVAFFAGLGALITGSGFTFRPLGAALVNRRGKRISRVRALWRAAVTWSPVVAISVIFKRGPDISDLGTGLLVILVLLIGILLAGAAWAVLNPIRGIQDRLAGTWIVPR